MQNPPTHLAVERVGHRRHRLANMHQDINSCINTSIHQGSNMSVLEIVDTTSPPYINTLNCRYIYASIHQHSNTSIYQYTHHLATIISIDPYINTLIHHRLATIDTKTSIYQDINIPMGGQGVVGEGGRGKYPIPQPGHPYHNQVTSTTTGGGMRGAGVTPTTTGNSKFGMF